MYEMLSVILAAALSATPPLVSAAESSAPSLDALRGAVERAAEEAGGVTGAAIVHVETGTTFGRRASERFPMASVFKLPVALAVLGRVDEEKMSLSKKVTIRREDLHPGAPIDERFEPGQTFTVGQLLEAQIVDSSNTAVDLMLKLVGGPKTVRARLSAWGFPDIDVSMDEKEMGRVYRKGARAFEADPRNTASPEAVARLLVRLQKGELVSPSSTALVLDMMRRCRTGDARIRALLPAGTTVFNKTGTIGRATNDAALIALPDGSHLAVVVFVKASPNGGAAREHAIALVARAAWEAFAANRPGG